MNAELSLKLRHALVFEESAVRALQEAIVLMDEDERFYAKRAISQAESSLTMTRVLLEELDDLTPELET